MKGLAVNAACSNSTQLLQCIALVFAAQIFSPACGNTAQSYRDDVLTMHISSLDQVRSSKT